VNLNLLALLESFDRVFGAAGETEIDLQATRRLTGREESTC
jgi:hypothetical protein